jgi:hypothetical protein
MARKIQVKSQECENKRQVMVVCNPSTYVYKAGGSQDPSQSGFIGRPCL